MESFYNWFLFQESADNFMQVRKYADYLKSNLPVHPEDFYTLLRFVQRATNAVEPDVQYNVFSDYYPIVQEVINLMEPEQQAAAKKQIQRMFTGEKIARKMAVHGVTEPEMNLDDFVGILDRAMHDKEFGIPALQYFIDKNKALWDYVDENKKKEFLDWMMAELKRQKDQPTLAQMLKQIFDKLEGEG